MTEIADNLSRARHLIERDGRPSGPATGNRQADTPDMHGQVMHTLYVAAHGTAVALCGYVTELQDRLEVGTRRRQPMAERPTTLEITEAQGMIARFSGFEQLAAAHMFGQPLPSADPGQRHPWSGLHGVREADICSCRRSVPATDELLVSLGATVARS